jgi:two-component system LytT family sensor kinase
MGFVYGFALGVVLACSAFAALQFARPRRIFEPGGETMRSALHAAMATLPHLRRGLTTESAGRAAPYLLTLTQAAAIAITDGSRMLAFVGVGDDHHCVDDSVKGFLAAGDESATRVEKPSCSRPDCPLGAAVVVPLVVQGEQVGALAALYASQHDVRPEDMRVVRETGSLVSAQIALAELETQGERLARAELMALRAQISPHFIYNALAAVGNSIHERPDEARELLAEFAEFTRYAFRSERPYVTLQDELAYVEKYLRLEQARFGDRLDVRVEVAPEVLAVVVPALSLQPLVENAVRHGIEATGRAGRVEILGADLDTEVELRVTDTGAGMSAERAKAALSGYAGGIGLANVHSRLQATFGPEYGLEIESDPARGTTVRMTFPKFRPGVRAA